MDRTLKPISLAVLFALLLNLAVAPFYWATLGLLVFSPLFGLQAKKPGQRFWLGWLGGFLLQAGGYYWIFFTIRDFGGLSAGLAVVGSILFFLFQGLDVGIWLWLAPKFGRTPVQKVYASAALWLVINHFYPYVFPWTIAATQAQGWGLKHMATWWGSTGLSFFCVVVAGGVALALAEKKLNRFIWLPVLTLFLLGWIPLPRVEKPELQVGVVQPNFIPFAKRDSPNGITFYETHRDMGRQFSPGSVDLILWPETALPFDIDAYSDYSDAVRIEAQNQQTALVIGCMSTGESGLPTNEIRLFPPDYSPIQRYQKQKMVLFSEELPWILRWALYFDPNLGSFDRGTFSGTFHYRDWDLVPLVCYEAILPEYVATKSGDVMLNLTNDAWFGESKGSALHLQSLVLRCLETGMPLIRATNSGISCAVTEQGEIINPTGVYVKTTARYTVRPGHWKFRPSRFTQPLFTWGSLLILAFMGWKSYTARRRKKEMESA